MKRLLRYWEIEMQRPNDQQAARDVIVRWWRDDKGQDYMGSPEGFADELIEELRLKGYEFRFIWVG